MPKIAEYDIRKAIWIWVLMKRKELQGDKFAIDRRPRFEFDMQRVQKQQYFHQFFDLAQSKKRRLKRAHDKKSKELNQQFQNISA